MHRTISAGSAGAGSPRDDSPASGFGAGRRRESRLVPPFLRSCASSGPAPVLHVSAPDVWPTLPPITGSVGHISGWPRAGDRSPARSRHISLGNRGGHIASEPGRDADLPLRGG